LIICSCRYFDGWRLTERPAARAERRLRLRLRAEVLWENLTILREKRTSL